MLAATAPDIPASHAAAVIETKRRNMQSAHIAQPTV
jgi:hypothetical protein